MNIDILSVGSNPPSDIAAIISSYGKRLQHTVTWRFIPSGEGNPMASKRKEAEKLLKLVSPHTYLILLDERGTTISSEQFSALLFTNQMAKTNVTFIIGGSYGVDKAVQKRADYVWSLSPLVFPHQLVRLLLIEQLYRADCIRKGHPYHHA